MTGYCDCHPYVTGKSCDGCEQYAFNYTASGCMPCNCDGNGSSNLQCDAVSKPNLTSESAGARKFENTVFIWLQTAP